MGVRRACAVAAMLALMGHAPTLADAPVKCAKPIGTVKVPAGQLYDPNALQEVQATNSVSMCLTWVGQDAPADYTIIFGVGSTTSTGGLLLRSFTLRGPKMVRSIGLTSTKDGMQRTYGGKSYFEAYGNLARELGGAR